MRSLAAPQRSFRPSKWPSAPIWKLLQMSEKDFSIGTSGRFRTETSPLIPENQKYGAAAKCHWPSMATVGRSGVSAIAGNPVANASAAKAASLIQPDPCTTLIEALRCLSS